MLFLCNDVDYSLIKKFHFLVFSFSLKGGMKSVIWTDVFQSAVMIAGLIVTAILGAREVGSLKMVFDIASEGQRLSIE